MTRDTEFVLENAEWPALLVDKSGKIQRANLAAVRVFGMAIESDAANLASIWSPENKDSAEKFLFQPPTDEPQPLKFYLQDGGTNLFLTQCCPGPERLFMIQFFKENKNVTPAPIIELPEIETLKTQAEDFILENAQWPAFVADAEGRILRVNAAVIRMFGPALEKPDALLANIWAPDNRESSQKFLLSPPK